MVQTTCVQDGNNALHAIQYLDRPMLESDRGDHAS